MKMNAMYVQPGGGWDRVTAGTCETPEPGPGEITVRLRAGSLNYHDYMIAGGMMPLKEPRIPLSDGAGEVTAVGKGVAEFAVGDSVVSTFFPGWLDGAAYAGGFAAVPGDGIDGYARESVTRPATAFTHIPAGYTHAEAATLTTAGLTAWRALMVDGSLKPGESVLVQGTGGVSVFALQFAKMTGAKVIATSSQDEKLARLKDTGADHVINYRKDPEWGETAFQLTGGRGVDHVIEVGGPATLKQSMKAACFGGHIALIGVLTGAAGSFSIAAALTRQLRLQGITVGSRRHQTDMIRAINANGIKPVIDRCFPLRELTDAFRYQESGRHFGKICMEI